MHNKNIFIGNVVVTIHRVLFSNIYYSVTRLGDFLDFGKLLNACGHNYFTQIATLSSIFVKVSKSIVKSFLGNFYRQLAIFFLVTLLLI